MQAIFSRLRRGRHTRLQELLSAYLDGELSPDEHEEVERHLASCRSCHGELEDLRATISLLRSMPQPAPRRSFTLDEAPAAVSRGVRGARAVSLATAAAVAVFTLAIVGDLSGLMAPTAAPGPQRSGSAPAPAAMPTPESGEEAKVPTSTLSQAVPEAEEEEMEAAGAAQAAEADDESRAAAEAAPAPDSTPPAEPSATAVPTNVPSATASPTTTPTPLPGAEDRAALTVPYLRWLEGLLGALTAALVGLWTVVQFRSPPRPGS